MTLQLENLSVVADGPPIIDNVSLSLEPGSMNVLLGPTLAGKTTLMRLMAGLEAPTSGRLFAKGADVTGAPVRKRSVAMVYQQFINYPAMSVYDNIASPLRVAGLSASVIDARVHGAARTLGLEPLLKRLPAQLSGGQQQRVAIARALVKGADLVLLDEPLANLDYKLREELREELPRILKQSNAILVYATTEPLEALQLGGNTATLWEGRLIQFGPTASIYRRPTHIDSARVFSDPPLNEVPIVIKDGAIAFSEHHRAPAIGALQGLCDGPYTLAFRADAMTLDQPSANAFKLEGKVAVAEISGSETFVHVDSPYGVFVCVEPGVSPRQPGQSVELYVDAEHVFVFEPSGAPARALANA